MAEMRFNPITLDWVIMAPDRELKPNDFRRHPSARAARPMHRDDCPFCPGNEHLATPEICRATNGNGGWEVRVIPNKFSAFTATDDLQHRSEGTFKSMAAAGVHEVVIEHPRHDYSFGASDPKHLIHVLRIYRERYRALRQMAHVASIVIFKNQGERAGSSLEHSHSQITATPMISAQVRSRMLEAKRFQESHRACLYCQVLQDELEAGERIVEAASSFVAFLPYASLSPYHMWIFPRQHAASFDTITDGEINELAGVLGRQLQRLASAAHDPDYNLTIRSAPIGNGTADYYHWYVAIVPRVSLVAGFELGCGSFINSMRPERCAEQMRAVRLDEPPA